MCSRITLKEQELLNAQVNCIESSKQKVKMELMTMKKDVNEELIKVVNKYYLPRQDIKEFIQRMQLTYFEDKVPNKDEPEFGIYYCIKRLKQLVQL